MHKSKFCYLTVSGTLNKRAFSINCPHAAAAMHGLGSLAAAGLDIFMFLQIMLNYLSTGQLDCDHISYLIL